MSNLILAMSIFCLTSQDKLKIEEPDPPLCLKTKGGDFVCVESNRKVVYLIDKDGVVKWVSRYFESRQNVRIIAVYDVDGVRKQGVRLPGDLPDDRVFIFTRPRTGKGHVEVNCHSILDGKHQFSMRD